MSQQEEAPQQPNEDQNELESEAGSELATNSGIEKNNFLFKSVPLRVAVHTISGLVNTRLSTEALKCCIMLIEAGVNPKILSEIVLHILDVKNKKLEEEHGPLLP